MNTVHIPYMYTIYVHRTRRYIYRVGQNRIYTPYMTVYFVMSLPKIPYIHRIYMVLANPIYMIISTVYTFVCMVLANPTYKPRACMHAPATFCRANHRRYGGELGSERSSLLLACMCAHAFHKAQQPLHAGTHAPSAMYGSAQHRRPQGAPKRARPPLLLACMCAHAFHNA